MKKHHLPASLGVGICWNSLANPVHSTSSPLCYFDSFVKERFEAYITLDFGIW